MMAYDYGGFGDLFDDLDLGGKESVEDRQLLRLTIQQALQSQYVLEHTRGIDHFLSPHKGITIIIFFLRCIFLFMEFIHDPFFFSYCF